MSYPPELVFPSRSPSVVPIMWIFSEESNAMSITESLSDDLYDALESLYDYILDEE